jgi:hypothetical protein
MKYIYDIHLRNDPDKLKTMLICALLDIASVTITTALLQETKILIHAEDLKGISLRESNQTWKTLHPAWDAELLAFLYKESKGTKGYRRVGSVETMEYYNEIGQFVDVICYTSE